MADDESDEEQRDKYVIPKYKLIYEDPELDIKMPDIEGEEKQRNERDEGQEEEKKVEEEEKPLQLILKGIII